MKRKSYLNKKSIRIIFTSFLFALIQVTLFTSCKKSSESFSLLNFSGVDNITNYSKMLFVSHPEEKDSLNFATLPVSKYDILLMEDYVFIYDDLPDNIRFGTSEDGNFTTINDKIYSIYIPADESLLPWFESIENKDLSALSFIDVDAKLNEVYLPHLKNLAGLVPGVGIHIDMDENKELLEIFNPRYLFSSFTNDDFNLFSKLSNLEVLQLDYIETNGEKPLPNMPKLKHIVFDLSNFSGTFSDDFFIHNKQLEKLTFLFLDQIDLSVLKPLNHLKELVIFEAGTIKNMSVLNELKLLEMLALKVGEIEFDMSTMQLPELKWLAINPGVTQKEFDGALIKSPKLEYVELIANDTIKSLQALSELDNLQGLIIWETVTDIPSIKELSNLKFLSLPAEHFKNRDDLKDIQQALPGVSLMATEGFCLGSGWLLFLFPLVFIFSFIVRNTGLKNKAEVR